jgi:DNA-binding NtrC family response regulator
MLSRHSWPGNVRELENVIGHACMMVMGDTIDVRDLPEYLWEPVDRTSAAAGDRNFIPETAAAPVGSLEEQERRLIIQALETAGGNQSQAARILRVGRDALRYKLKKYNLAAT